MIHPNVYKLSKKYGPPQVDLRQASIADAWDDDSHSTLIVHHRVPKDVTREHLDFYTCAYSFIGTTDLLFYLYPIAREHEAEGLDCIDFFLYTLDSSIQKLMAQLPPEDQAALREGILWIWESGGPDSADWGHCPHLQRVIGLQ